MKRLLVFVRFLITVIGGVSIIGISLVSCSEVQVSGLDDESLQSRLNSYFFDEGELGELYSKSSDVFNVKNMDNIKSLIHEHGILNMRMCDAESPHLSLAGMPVITEIFPIDNNYYRLNKFPDGYLILEINGNLEIPLYYELFDGDRYLPAFKLVKDLSEREGGEYFVVQFAIDSDDWNQPNLNRVLGEIIVELKLGNHMNRHYNGFYYTSGVMHLKDIGIVESIKVRFFGNPEGFELEVINGKTKDIIYQSSIDEIIEGKEYIFNLSK